MGPFLISVAYKTRPSSFSCVRGYTPGTLKYLNCDPRFFHPRKKITHCDVRLPYQVLAIGSRIIVLGEVGEDLEGTEGDLVLRKAAPYSILDLKTASITKPFVVSTKTEQGLLAVRPFLSLPFV